MPGNRMLLLGTQGLITPGGGLPPNPPTPSMYAPKIYGSAMNIDSRGNRRVAQGRDCVMIAYGFIASQNSAISSVNWVQRGNGTTPNSYSNGTGGTYQGAILTDDGTGKPGAVVATSTTNVAPGNPAGDWERCDANVFGSSPYTPTVGQKVYFRLDNIAGTETDNYCSANQAFRFGTPLNPRNPAFTNDLQIWEWNGTLWVQNTSHTPVFSINYANGQFDGNGYMGIITGSHGNISGTTTMVRERFTVSGGDKVVTELWMRLGRQSGTDKVLLRLENSVGTLIEEGLMVEDPTTFPLASPGATYSGDWLHYTLSTPRTLTNGQAYSLRASCAGTSTWWAMPIVGGNFPTGGSPAEHDWASRRFTDGNGQKTTDSGGTWPALYSFLPENTQSYMRLQ